MLSHLQSSQSFHSCPGVIELPHHIPRGGKVISEALSHTFTRVALG